MSLTRALPAETAPYIRKMNVYVINLDRAPERMEFTRKKPVDAGFECVRIEAIDGATVTLPHPNVSERGLRLMHGVGSISIQGTVLSLQSESVVAAHQRSGSFGLRRFDRSGGVSFVEPRGPVEPAASRRSRPRRVSAKSLLAGR